MTEGKLYTSSQASQEDLVPGMFHGFTLVSVKSLGVLRVLVGFIVQVSPGESALESGGGFAGMVHEQVEEVQLLVSGV